MPLARIDVQGIASSTNGTGHITQTINSAGADFIAAWCSVNATGDTTFTATFNSVSMGTGTKDGTTGQLSVVFTLKAPSTGAGLTIDVSTALNNFPCTLIGVTYSGVNQTTPIGTIDKVGGSAALGSSNSITCAAGNWILSGLAVANNTGPSIAAGTHGNTSVLVVGTIGSSCSGAYGEDTDGANDTFDWTWTGANAWSALSFELKAAAATTAADGRDLSIPVRPTGPTRRRAFKQVYADTPATPVELTQSPAAPFRPGRGPGKGPMLLRRNLVWPSPTYSPDVTLALTGVQAAGAVGTLGVQLDVATTGNAATASVGTLTPALDVSLTGLAATGSVGTLAPSTDVALTGVAGTGSVGTLAPSTTVTLTGNEATVTIGTLSPSGDVTVALTGVSASALVGDLSPSGGDVVVGAADTGSGGGSSLTFDEWLARHPWLRDYELRPNWYAYPPEKKKLKKQILAAAKERKRVSQQLSFAKDRSELDKLLEILNTLQERYNALQELYRAGLAAWQQSRAAEAEEEAEFMEHLINLL